VVVFELQKKKPAFFWHQDHEHPQALSEDEWVAKLVYLSDVLEFLNEINRNKQIKNKNIEYSTDKIHGLRGKVTLCLQFNVSGSTVFSSGADKALLYVAEHICEP
jgi:hypothetical protein